MLPNPNMKTYLEQLLQVFDKTTWDGNLISKSHRDILVRDGFIVKSCGYNLITPEGVKYLYELGLITSQ